MQQLRPDPIHLKCEWHLARRISTWSQYSQADIAIWRPASLILNRRLAKWLDKKFLWKQRMKYCFPSKWIEIGKTNVCNWPEHLPLAPIGYHTWNVADVAEFWMEFLARKVQMYVKGRKSCINYLSCSSCLGGITFSFAWTKTWVLVPAWSGLLSWLREKRACHDRQIVTRNKASLDLVLFLRHLDLHLGSQWLRALLQWKDGTSSKCSSLWAQFRCN